MLCRAAEAGWQVSAGDETKGKANAQSPSRAWVSRWKDMIAAEPELPGVWRRKAGGFHIRARVKDARTGQMREVNRVLADAKRAREALAILTAELERAREGTIQAAEAVPTFADWAVRVLERKIATGKITASSGRRTWASLLAHHLIPAFGPVYVDKLTREDVERLKLDMLAARSHAKGKRASRKLKAGRYSAETVNSVLAVLRQITSEASDTFNIADPCRRVEAVPKRGHRTYTYEAPNSLKPGDVARFLDETRVRYPEHYAFVFLGFTTGLRPSSLRPLRRRGPSADIKWDTAELLVRRSQTHGAEVMEETKTGRDQMIALDERQVEALRWHVDRLEKENAQRAKRYPKLAEAMAASDLLFPAGPTRHNAGGGFRSQSCMDKMFRDLGERLAIGYPVTPRAMRRTYQDLCRAASVADIVTRAISGHATPEMQRHYSTVSGAEMRAGLAKVIDIATGHERRAA